MDFKFGSYELNILSQLIPTHVQQRFASGIMSLTDYVEYCSDLMKKIIKCQKQFRIKKTRKRIIEKNKKELINKYWRTYTYLKY